jgi:uncharacterized protein YjeT (DUF2065 family)
MTTEMTTVRRLMAIESISLLIAAALHAGLVIPGPFDTAAIFETSIALVLLPGLAIATARPAWAGWAALATQAFALIGTAIGLVLVVRGVGPNSVPDVVYHVVLIALIAIGLGLAWQARQS